MAGVPLLPNQLGSSARLIVEAAFGANLSASSGTWTWTDISADVLLADGQRIVISPFGRSDAASITQPAGCSFSLRNLSGNYTAYDPGSSHYPNVRKNTPIRVSVDLGSGPQVRFLGYANGWVPSWDTSGRAAVVSVSASGTLRRLGKGSVKLPSALFQAITTASDLPDAYWPCEDGSDGLSVSQALSPIPGCPPLTAIGASNFAALDGAPGSDKQPNFGAGGSLAGFVPNAPSTATWRIQCMAKINTVTSPDFAVPIEWETIDGNAFELIANATVDGGLSYSDTLGNTFSSLVKIDDGLWHEWRCNATQSGSNTFLEVYLDGVSIMSHTLTSTNFTRITRVYSNRAGSVSGVVAGVGHFAVWNGATTISGLDTADAMRGHAGELATTRMTRLCTERGEQITITGTSTTQMGPQRIDTLLNLLRECEAADMGILVDGTAAGLTYITRLVREGQAASLTLDGTPGLGQLPSITPVDDDQRSRNMWTVARVNGGSQTYEDEAGPLGTDAIGTYDDSVTLNLADDSPLENLAAWLVALGTVKGFRYPTATMNFARSPSKAASWLATSLQERIDITHPSAVATQHPDATVSLLLEGYTENLSKVEWTVTANCSPYQPWRLIVLAQDSGDSGEFLCHLDVDDVTLNAGVSAGATSLSLKTNSGQLLTTVADDFPMDLDVGGVQVTCTAISGTSSPQTATVTGSTVTKALPSGTAVAMWNPPNLGL